MALLGSRNGVLLFIFCCAKNVAQPEVFGEWWAWVFLFFCLPALYISPKTEFKQSDHLLALSEIKQPEDK